VRRSKRDATQDASDRLLRVSSTDQNQVMDDDGASFGADDAVAVAGAGAGAGAEDDTAFKPYVVPDADREDCFELVAARRRINGVGRCQQLDVLPDLAVFPCGDRSSQTVTPHAATGPGCGPTRTD